ncbi:hypothetical protein DAPK24_016750 [Pichia kluyveri]|uniref:Decapping nuclease n=1 Tax=Pichia kluyveri TaxID=36015 RepID=A0AAV5R101_PICKL|nr:hypothetical protein DAPK24_016750 [Pichia kluyveri]
MEDYDKGRPKEIFRYSCSDEKLSFDYRELPSYCLNENLRPGPLKYGKKRPILGLKGGIGKYNRKVFTEKESKIRMFLLTLLVYESINNVSYPIEDTIDKKEIEILAHNGRMIFANTATRVNQNRLYSYIGVKFESIVCKTNDPIDSSHCKLLLKGKYGEWRFKSVVEIDGFRRNKEEQKIEDFSIKERAQRYTEMKLCCISDDSKIIEVDNIRSKKEFIEFLAKNVKSFRLKVKKWLFQSYFSREDILVIGIRDGNVKLICYEEISIEYDLIPYIKEHYDELYNLFINRESTLNDAFNKIYDGMIALREHEKDVFTLNTKTLEVKKVEKGNGYGGNELFNDILIEEYRIKIEKNKDILKQCSIINQEQFNELKMKSMIDEMDKLIQFLKV